MIIVGTTRIFPLVQKKLLKVLIFYLPGANLMDYAKKMNFWITKSNSIVLNYGGFEHD